MASSFTFTRWIAKANAGKDLNSRQAANPLDSKKFLRSDRTVSDIFSSKVKV